MKTKGGIAFMVELLLMFLILLMVIVVITTVSVKNRTISFGARYLTESVILAESVAEVSSKASGPEETGRMIETMENAASVTVDGDTVTAEVNIDGDDGKTDLYTVSVKVTEEDGAAGGFTEKKIEVFRKGSESPVYTLETGNYIKEGEQ